MVEYFGRKKMTVQDFRREFIDHFGVDPAKHGSIDWDCLGKTVIPNREITFEQLDGFLTSPVSLQLCKKNKKNEEKPNPPSSDEMEAYFGNKKMSLRDFRKDFIDHFDIDPKTAGTADWNCVKGAIGSKKVTYSALYTEMTAQTNLHCSSGPSVAVIAGAAVGSAALVAAVVAIFLKQKQKRLSLKSNRDLVVSNYYCGAKDNESSSLELEMKVNPMEYQV